jgi:heat shock protein HslJ
MRRFLPVSAVGVALLIGWGASTATAIPADSAAKPGGALTGKVWILTTLHGKAPVKGTELTLELTLSRRASGSTGCNRFTGPYHATRSTIRIGRLATTQKACADPVMGQERSFLEALSRARSFAVTGRKLTLKAADGRSLATFEAQTQGLAGTSWEVLAYNNGKQAVVSVLAATKLTAAFGKGGTLTGFAGCNDYSASYKTTAPKITIGPVSSTRKHCETPAGVGEQETSYLAALETAATYRIEGSQLKLRPADGAIAVELRRV